MAPEEKSKEQKSEVKERQVSQSDWDAITNGMNFSMNILKIRFFRIFFMQQKNLKNDWRSQNLYVSNGLLAFSKHPRLGLSMAVPWQETAFRTIENKFLEMTFKQKFLIDS